MIMKQTAALLLCASLLFSGCSQQAVPEVPPTEPMPTEPSFILPPEPKLEPEPEPEPEPQPRSFTLIAVGDMMAHWDQIEDALQPDGSYDFTHSFAAVEADIAQGYAVGTLETVFGGPETGYSCFPRFSTPDAYGWALKNAGFDFVSTSNNHSLDRDGAGLLRTLEKLDEMGLAHTGTYTSKEAAGEITIVQYEGVRIAFLAYTFSTNGIPIPDGSAWMVNMLEEEKLKSDLEKAKTLEPDLIVVMPHMGNEYETHTNDIYLNLMDRMLYHGADIVLASHPHVLQKMMVREFTDAQGIEREGFIICSLGNFISVQRTEPRDIGIILKLELSQQPGERPVLEHISFVPIWVSYRDNTGSVNIRVVPVGDALSGLAGDNPLMLNGWNADRLWRANSEITAMYLGSPVPRDDLAREYTFYRRQAE